MGFDAEERQLMLALKGVGPTVIDRLEQIGFSSLADVAGTDAMAINRTVAQMLHAIAAVVALANQRHPS